MIRNIIAGLWLCCITFASGYFVVQWQVNASPGEVKKAEPTTTGVEYHNLPSITVPMIKAGVVQGYVVAKLIFTADSKTMRDFPGDIQPFLVDEVFREIYQFEKVDFANIPKYNFDEIFRRIRKSVNDRVGAAVIKDVLVNELNYVSSAATKR